MFSKKPRPEPKIRRDLDKARKEYDKQNAILIKWNRGGLFSHGPEDMKTQRERVSDAKHRVETYQDELMRRGQ